MGAMPEPKDEDLPDREFLLRVAAEVERGERPRSDLDRYGIKMGPPVGGDEAKKQLIRELGIDDEDPDAPPHVRAHFFCGENREIVLKSKTCGCFYCLETFPSAAVTQWNEHEAAVCPKCGRDTLVPSESGFPIDAKFLRVMKDYWEPR
jgi:hypothetical protein